MRLLDRYSALAAALLATVILVVGLLCGARTAGGADAFGYVSEAYLWRGGSLHIDRPLIAELPWPYAAESMSPLGYRPGRGTTIVPTYSPGVPLIMAAFAALFGACGPFVVSPLFAAAGVAGSYILCLRLSRNRAASTIAAVLMATSPVFVFHVMLPMSDVATMTLWTVSLCAVTWRGVSAAAVGGVFAGLAILARPNLAPLAAAGVAAAMLWPVDPTSQERNAWRRALLRRAGAYLLSGVVPAALSIAWLNNHLYGSPLRSGYGETRLLYAWSHATTNIRAYGESLILTEGAMLVLAMAAVLSARPRAAWRHSVPPVIFCLGLAASYLFYQPQEGWTFLRFLLPAFPLMFGAVGVLIVAASARVQKPILSGGIAALVCLLACVRLAPYMNDVLSLGEGEDRYVAVAQYVERALPPNAVVFAKQHSGTIGFYSGKPTLRHDWFTTGRFQHALVWLRDRGYRPYLVLENWEEEEFRRRFGTDTALGRLHLRVLAEYRGGVDVRIYDPFEETPDPGRPFRLAARHECRAPSPLWTAPFEGVALSERSESKGPALSERSESKGYPSVEPKPPRD